MVHPRRPTLGACVAPAALALALVVAPASHAATLGLDQRCYVTGEQAGITGSGFAARTAITLDRAGESVAAATPTLTDNSGAFRRTLLVPEVPGGLVESQVEVTATDGTSTARTFLNIAAVTANFAPATGDLRTLRVSHVVSGFGLAEDRPSIYVHYVSPAAQKVATKNVAGATVTTTSATATGAPKTGGSTVSAPDPAGVKTVRLGQLRGPCGVLRTSPRKLFPFKATDGTWLLQYDTRPRYTRGTTGSSFLWVARKVTVG
ncbi:MAG: hypothetical protein PGN13_03355 [Patulibacter minatonensis]